MVEKKQDKIINMNLLILIISIILIAIAIFINKSVVIRPILWLIAIFLISLNLGIKNKFKITSTIIFILIFLTISIVADGIIVYTFKRIPVFSYNIISTKNTIVYNSIGMRVWQCDKKDFDKLIVDPFYEKGYMCSADDIDVIDANSFLNSVTVNYNEYKNRYVKINGKISKKSGQNQIEFRPYTTSDITVNGYVEFADNIIARVIFNNSDDALDNYDVYDEITIVGIVKNLENEGNRYVIYLYDSRVVGNINLNEYTITVTSKNKCTEAPTLIHSNDTNDIHSYCIEEMIVSFPDNMYELPQALSSNKITIDDIYSSSDNIIDYEEDERKIYKFDDYSVLVCDQSLSRDIYIGNKKMSFDDVECKLKVEE